MHNMESDHFVNALPPVADAFAGTAVSDVIEVVGDAIEFIAYRGVGASGTSVVTVLACDDVTPTTTVAVPFWYKEITSDPGDTSWTLATAAGFTTTAGSNAMFRIYTTADLIGANGYGYAQLNLVEGVDSPVLGGILARVINTAKQPQKTTVLV